MMIQIQLRYPIGIAILGFTGIMGGDVFMTSIEIGICFALLDWVNGGHNTPRGT